MPVLNLESFTKSDDEKQNLYLYRDLHLDIKQNSILTENSLFKTPVTTDIEIDYDEGAIKNSLINLFSTMPGQRLLVPEYGLNLAQFLFTPITRTRAREIGEKIVNGVEKYEPRVSILNVNVDPREEDNMYIIDLGLKVPRLSNSSVNFSGILKQPGFSFL